MKHHAIFDPINLRNAQGEKIECINFNNFPLLVWVNSIPFLINQSFWSMATPKCVGDWNG